MKTLALTIAFILEIVAFCFFAGVAFVPAMNQTIQIIVAALLFVVLIVFWSLYMAPKATKKLSALPYYIAKSIIYAVTAFSILNLLNATYCLVFVALAILDEATLLKHNLSK